MGSDLRSRNRPSSLPTQPARVTYLRTLPVALALALLLAGCGDDDGPAPTDAGARMDAATDAGVRLDAAGTDAGMVVGTDGGDVDAGAVVTDAGLGTDSGVATNASVVTHHNSPTRNGVYIAPALTRAAAATIHVDTAFSATIEGPTYAHPLFFDAGGAGPDLVIVATEQNKVYAFNATTGAEVWQVTLGTPVPLSMLPCGNINPLGITGTPYLDVGRRMIFLDAMMRVGGANKHRIFALSLDDGSTVAGWPVDADSAVTFGAFTFDSDVQNQRGALLVLGDTLYVPYGGHYGDCGAYRGWVVGIPIASPGTAMAWATRARGAGSWAPGGVASDGTDLFVTTGNGFGTTTWSDQEAVVRLGPGPVFSGDTTDFFSPTNWLTLDAGDIDLGGSGPVLIHVPGATPADLAVALGKDGYAYLVDRANMGGIGMAVAMSHVAPNPIVTAASAYPTATGVNVVFRGRGTMCPSGDMTALRITAASPPAIETAWCANGNGNGSPIVTTTDGMSESIVWTIGAEGNNRLQAFNGDTGAVIFDGAGTAVDMVRRYVSPIVGKGRIYFAGATGVHAFTIE